MCEVLTIGEPMVMFLADTKEPLSQVDHFTKMIAGAELNVAMGLSRLGHNVSYMTQVGEDPFGEYIKDFLKKEQIDTSYIKETNIAPTGFQIKNQVDGNLIEMHQGDICLLNANAIHQISKIEGETIVLNILIEKNVGL